MGPCTKETIFASKWASDETEGRLEEILAAPMSRSPSCRVAYGPHRRPRHLGSRQGG